MNAKRDARVAMAYLEEICGQLDGDRRLRRPRHAWWQVPLWASAAVGLVALSPACGGTVDDEADEICDNDADDDGDGDVDCADRDCNGFTGCMSALYAAPVEICDNDADDDGDGAVDCDDSSCASDPNCVGLMYAAPIEICDNGVDDDFDEAVDCADEDCYGDPACADGALYAAPS
ncbi:MAG: hypothetical protein JRI23_07035 [Deltaproteobacteria bacterium]|jgi:hypothetical protein|nr:hypothetical protein [Deltaproteobacteria bacterium]MBW2531342.1 hypothetical protein [Deltaproteobacteria bacterium]